MKPNCDSVNGVLASKQEKCFFIANTVTPLPLNDHLEACKNQSGQNPGAAVFHPNSTEEKFFAVDLLQRATPRSKNYEITIFTGLLYPDATLVSHIYDLPIVDEGMDLNEIRVLVWRLDEPNSKPYFGYALGNFSHFPICMFPI